MSGDAANRPLFHVKICGVTSAADARLVATAGADAVGLNFVAGSPRRLTAAAARAVAEALPPGVLRVGVFAGATVEEMLETLRTVGLDALQLHGHLVGAGAAVDPPERCAELAPWPVIRAVRLGPDGFGPAREWIARAVAHGCGPALALVDAGVDAAAAGAALGGTGARADWDALRTAGGVGVPLALAGGLTPENVAGAIARTGVGAVDVASGVESAPGHKDPARVRAFVAAARAALGLGAADTLRNRPAG